MDGVARNENNHSSKKQRVMETLQPNSLVEHNKKYVPDWQVFENNSVFEDKNIEIAVELMRGTVLPADRVYVNSLHPMDVSSQLMQSIAQMPALVDKLTQECLESQRRLKSIEATLKLEKVERKMWEHQYKELYSNLHIDGVDADQIGKEESPIQIELERKLDEKQKNIGALEEGIKAMKNLKDKDDLAFNQRIKELNEQVHALQKQIEQDKTLIEWKFVKELEEKQKTIRELEEKLKAMEKQKVKINLAYNEKIGQIKTIVARQRNAHAMEAIRTSSNQRNDPLKKEV